jgi:hypothetical protein
VVYQFCLLLAPHAIAYGIGWIAGLIFLVSVYPSRVFAVPDSSWSQKFYVALLYFMSFMVGLWLLNRLVQHQLPPEWAIFIVLATTTIVNFFGMRSILRVSK